MCVELVGAATLCQGVGPFGPKQLTNGPFQVHAVVGNLASDGLVLLIEARQCIERLGARGKGAFLRKDA